MKRNLTAALLSIFMVTGAGAQTMYDALKYSENNYYGTARSIAMGNAFTALGGDVGSIGINPAGSAINYYTQFTITPNVSIAATSSQYNSEPSGSNSFGSSLDASKSKFTVPNFGAVTTIRTGRVSGLKSISFGFVGNATAYFLDNVSSLGRNTSTTYLGYLAATSSGYQASELNRADYSSGYPWHSIIAYKSGMIANYGSHNDEYIGATEAFYNNGKEEITLAGPVDQKYGRESYGNKYDCIINFGMNFSDRFYVGANLGLVSLDYTNNSYFKEAAVSPSDFKNEFEDGTTYFDNMRFRENYNATGTGVYGKFGFIYLPVGGLRIGGAIQTPTANYITETWQYAGETYFTDSRYNAYAVSDEGHYEYKLVSPWRFNIGAAYSFMYGVVSADYEFTDFSGMKYREKGTNNNSGFDLENGLINNFFGAQHSVRVGIEFKPVAEFSIRAGYNFKTSPECYLYDSEGIVDTGVYQDMYYSNISDSEFYNWRNSLNNKTYVKAYTHAVALGAGYSSKGSFFCDLAFRATIRPDQYTYPYDTYIENTLSPEIKTSSRFYDIVATFGWRF